MDITERYELRNKYKKAAYPVIRKHWSTNVIEWFWEEDLKVNVDEVIPAIEGIAPAKIEGTISFAIRKEPVYVKHEYGLKSSRMKEELRKNGFHGLKLKTRKFTSNGVDFVEITAIKFKVA